MAVRVHRAELGFRRVDLLKLEAVVVDGEAEALEVLEERVNGVDLSRREERVHDAIAVRPELRDLRGGNQRGGGNGGGGDHGLKLPQRPAARRVIFIARPGAKKAQPESRWIRARVALNAGGV